MLDTLWSSEAATALPQVHFCFTSASLVQKTAIVSSDTPYSFVDMQKLMQEAAASMPGY